MRTAVLLCATIMVHERDCGDETGWAHEQVDIHSAIHNKRISTNLGDLSGEFTHLQPVLTLQRPPLSSR